ncbi:MAG TPA: hypothetical protein VGV65_04580 [Nocardioides sp.]|nr:hypothetical protein [Nocardioides sp.]
MSDWREQDAHEVRALVLEAAPDATEDVKWRKASNPDGVPTFSADIHEGDELDEDGFVALVREAVAANRA